MKEIIKPVTPEEVADQNKTVQKTKEQEKLEDENELNVKKKELKNNKRILNGYDDQEGFMPDMDTRIESNKKYLEMKDIEFKKDEINGGNRRVAYEGDQRWRQLKKEIFLTPEPDKIKRSIKRMEEQEKEIMENNPELQKRINELGKKLGKKVI